jgi:hypothetical protein
MLRKIAMVLKIASHSDGESRTLLANSSADFSGFLSYRFFIAEFLAIINFLGSSIFPSVFFLS